MNLLLIAGILAVCSIILALRPSTSEKKAVQRKALLIMWAFLALSFLLGFFWFLSLFSSPHSEGALMLLKLMFAPITLLVAHSSQALKNSQLYWLGVLILCFAWSYFVGFVIALFSTSPSKK